MVQEYRPVRILLKGQAKAKFEELNLVATAQQAEGITNSDEIQLLKSIMQKADSIKENRIYGDNIPKKSIPKSFDVSNLFRVELVGYWRMLYSLETNENEIIAFITHILKHKDYDKLFGYRKK